MSSVASGLSASQLRQAAHDHLWLHFTRMAAYQDSAMPIIVRGDGCYLEDIDGKRYSHILDPRTGLGLVGRMSVTVVAQRGIDSDSLTKTICVLGVEKGMPLLEKIEGVSALAVMRTEKGDAVTQSWRFPAPGAFKK